ncbi:lamin tail domain-containing protein [Aureispira sp. CCB-E]|uniref:lamin tail domain-containing protein n=1 Tax=Aureispira sp. CCB-E TaxID=3051121 RepID=UPI002868FC09|nr:lamin tail domain-containing protein [Aureispira sp. CCB-E]WMX16186.1 lamin tail domain-containing protein [Aureispira sp. CCB-E]
MPNLIYLLLVLLGASPIVANPIVITEIHHSPNILGGEFLELHNKSQSAVTLSKWKFTKGIEYTFPEGTILEGGAYLVVAKRVKVMLDEYELGERQQVLGPFKGRLKGEGECLVLKNHLGEEVDRVNYKDKATWPYCKKKVACSLQLINPAFDNRIGQYWEVATPSPTRPNTPVFTPHLLPIIKHVDQYPQVPKSNEAVTIVANVRNAKEVQLWYQVVAPGSYIALEDSTYQTNWMMLTMLDNGKEGDWEANDRIYTLKMPPSLQRHRHLIRYKIIAKGDSISIAPRQSHPQPNFAYFVYDKVPTFCGYSFDSLRTLPVCHLIAKSNDVQYLIYEHEARTYKATGTVVYNGVVYDHVGYRSRGYNNRHSRRKRNLKFNFHNNAKIEVVNNQGKAYATRRNKLVLSGGWLLDNPNTHGLSESVLYRLFRLQGTSASHADYLHLRVVQHQEEQDSVEGDFWGLYLMLENYDGDFLKTHDLPNANIYSYKPFKVRHKSNQKIGLQQKKYVDWDSSCYQQHSIEWWKENLDWENYLGFLIGNELIANKESGYRKQHWWTEYRHPEKGWQFFPWDVDKTWTSSRIKSTISSGIFKAAFEHQALEIAYENELRSVLDLLFNEEQMFQLIDEQAAFIYQPSLNYSFVDLDKLRWGHEYEGSFENQIGQLKRFVQRRRKFILQEILHDSIPDTPTITYHGSSQYEVDALKFKIGNIDRETIQAVEWRIAEVNKKDQKLHSETDPKIYEIVTKWEGKYRTPFETLLSLPLGAVQPKHRYRIRVRVQDTIGYCSHWSEPIEFIPQKMPDNYGTALVINELLWQSKDGLEFIEIHNPSTTTIHLAQFEFKAGIHFKFSDTALIKGGEYCVLTNNSKLFKSEYGFEANGSYQGKLSNKGERLMLYNAFGELVDSVHYVTYWNDNTQECTSLELVYTTADNALAANWNCSVNVQGTPGRINSVLKETSDTLQRLWIMLSILLLGVGGYKLKGKVIPTV